MAAILQWVRHPQQCYLSYKESATTSLSKRVASCTEIFKQFHASYLDGNSPFRKSIAGRVLFGLGFETVGAVAGAAIGESFIGSACRRLAPVIAVASIGGALYSLRGRAILVTAAALCVPCAMAAFPSTFSLMTLWIGGAGTWFGANAGTVLGGYAGLCLLGSRVTLWDGTDESHTYAVAMGRSIIAGEIFQRAINPALPWSLLLVARPVVQMMFYHLGAVIGVCRSLCRERQFKQEVIIPLIVKSLCDKYCERNARPFTNSLVSLISSTVGVIPWMEKQLEFLLKLERFQTFFKNTVDQFNKNSHKMAAALMRSFSQYMQLLKSDPSMGQLKGEISQATLTLLDTFFSAKTDAMAKSILSSIQQAGVDLYGSPIPVDIVKNKPLLSMHIRHFLAFFLRNYDFRTLKEHEEQIFIAKLIDAFTSVLDQPCSSHRIIGLLGKGIQVAVPPTYFLKKHIGRFVEPPEQSSSLECVMQIPEELGAALPVHVEAPVGRDYQHVDKKDASKARKDLNSQLAQIFDCTIPLSPGLEAVDPIELERGDDESWEHVDVRDDRDGLLHLDSIPEEEEF